MTSYTNSSGIMELGCFHILRAGQLLFVEPLKFWKVLTEKRLVETAKLRMPHPLSQSIMELLLLNLFHVRTYDDDSTDFCVFYSDADNILLH